MAQAAILQVTTIKWKETQLQIKYIIARSRPAGRRVWMEFQPWKPVVGNVERTIPTEDKDRIDTNTLSSSTTGTLFVSLDSLVRLIAANVKDSSLHALLIQLQPFVIEDISDATPEKSTFEEPSSQLRSIAAAAREHCKGLAELLTAPSALSSAERIVAPELIDRFRDGMPTSRYRTFLKSIDGSFRGSAAVDWMLKEKLVTSRVEGVELCKSLMARDVFGPLGRSKDDGVFLDSRAAVFSMNVTGTSSANLASFVRPVAALPVRVVCVGPSQSGKSSLCHLLAPKSEETAAANNAPQFLRVRNATFDLNGEEETAAVWDLTAPSKDLQQESKILSSLIAPLMLSPRQSVYLLVLNLNVSVDEFARQLDQWSELLAENARDAPVVVAFNFADQPPNGESLAPIQELFKTRYARRLGNSVKSIVTSAVTGQGISQLRFELVSAIKRINTPTNNAVAKFAASCGAVSRVIRENHARKLEYITAEDLKETAAKHNIGTEIEKLLQYLHGSGTLIPVLFQGNRYYTNLNHVVLFCRSFLGESLAKVPAQGLEKPIQLAERDRDVERLLVQQLRVIHSLGQGGSSFLVPAALSPSAPPFAQLCPVKSASLGVDILYRYYTFNILPRGVLHEFAARMTELLKQHPKNTYWQNGFRIYKDDSNSLAVLLQRLPSPGSECRVNMMIQGALAPGFISEVTQTMNALLGLQEFSRIEDNYRIEFPCVCEVCNFSAQNTNDERAHGFPHNVADVEKMLLAGEMLLPCISGLQTRIDVLAPDLALKEVESLLVPRTQLTLGKQLGKGSFGTVYRGQLGGGDAAIKQIPTTGGENSSTTLLADFRREVLIEGCLRHPNLVPLLAYSADPKGDNLYMCLELSPHGDLFGYLQKRATTPLPVAQMALLAYQIAAGMEYLHDVISPSLVHRDLKSPNVLLYDAPHKGMVLAKVADFGESTFAAAGTSRGNLFNPRWLAPEVMGGGKFIRESDIYSYAIVMWEIQHRMIPFEGEAIASGFQAKFEEYCQTISASARESAPEYVSLCERCWSDDPEKRPPWAEIKKVLSALLLKADPSLSSAIADTLSQATARAELFALVRDKKRPAGPVAACAGEAPAPAASTSKRRSTVSSKDKKDKKERSRRDQDKGKEDKKRRKEKKAA